MDNTAAKDGGALYLYETTVALSDNTFSGNAVSSGGALMVGYLGSYTSEGDTSTDNAATLSGGAVQVSSGAAVLVDPTMLWNSAQWGGSNAGGLSLSGALGLGVGKDDNRSGYTTTIGAGPGSAGWR